MDEDSENQGRGAFKAPLHERSRNGRSEEAIGQHVIKTLSKEKTKHGYRDLDEILNDDCGDDE